MTSTTASRPGISYLAIIALLTSIGALTTDIMLPALGVIGRDLGVADINSTTLIVTAFFFGMAIGQLFAGRLPTAMAASRWFLSAMRFSSLAACCRWLPKAGL